MCAGRRPVTFARSYPRLGFLALNTTTCLLDIRAGKKEGNKTGDYRGIKNSGHYKIPVTLPNPRVSEQRQTKPRRRDGSPWFGVKPLLVIVLELKYSWYSPLSIEIYPVISVFFGRFSSPIMRLFPLWEVTVDYLWVLWEELVELFR